ncbi:MAG: hypothetical protein M5U28_01310 [Sandaracinaceae bacterium]|nr:hypothetical protein [Sandaracinaceae bacterium]
MRVWIDVKQTLPEPDATVRVVAQQWAWTFVHPGPDGRLDTEDDITTTERAAPRRGHHLPLPARGAPMSCTASRCPRSG